MEHKFSSRAADMREEPNVVGAQYFVKLVVRRWISILVTTVVIGVLLSFIVILRPPSYQSTALLLYDRAPFDFRSPKESRVENDVDTQVEMLNGLSVVKLVAARLDAAPPTTLHPPKSDMPSVDNQPTKHNTPWIDRFRSNLAWIREGWPALTAPVSSTSTTDVVALQKQFRIRRRGITDVIAIEARADKPERAAHLANLYADVYLAEQQRSQFAAIERMEKIISHRIEVLSMKLSENGANTKLRTELSNLSETLTDVRNRRHTLTPELRMAAAALPIPILAFPTPSVLLTITWISALLCAIALSTFRDRRHRIPVSGS
jgi:uncharacterized protein involved in exopolysaccharide biosynthesis